MAQNLEEQENHSVLWRIKLSRTWEPSGSSGANQCGLTGGACGISFGPLLSYSLYCCAVGVDRLSWVSLWQNWAFCGCWLSDTECLYFYLKLLISWVVSWEETLGICMSLQNPVCGGRFPSSLPSLCREYRYKTNITFHDNDTVSFMEYRRLFFQPDLSNGTEEDYVVIPNIMLMVRTCSLN